MTEVRVAVPARAHLAGNPSDGYGGAVVSVTIPSMTATVTVQDCERFEIRGPTAQWASIEHMADHTERVGYDDGDRLVRAALLTLHRALDPSVDRRPGSFEWRTAIPRSVGLGGSSAVVVATMRAALGHWGAETPPDGLDLAVLALRAETDELGIAAGLADRAAQVLGGVVLTDARASTSARRIDPARRIDATILWRSAAASPSGEYHARLRSALEAGDPAMRRGLDELAALADRAATAIADGDTGSLASALDGSLAVRRRLGGVPAPALEGIDDLRAGGAAVNFAGSGGAVVVLGPCDPPPGWSSEPLIIG